MLEPQGPCPVAACCRDSSWWPPDALPPRYFNACVQSPITDNWLCAANNVGTYPPPADLNIPETCKALLQSNNQLGLWSDPQLGTCRASQVPVQGCVGAGCEIRRGDLGCDSCVSVGVLINGGDRKVKVSAGPELVPTRTDSAYPHFDGLETIYEETTCAGSVGRATFETFNQVYETLQSRAAEEQLNLKDMCCDGLCATQAQEECVLNEGQGDEPCVWDFGASDAGSGASQGQRLMALREQLAAMSREELLELRKEHEELVEQMGERD